MPKKTPESNVEPIEKEMVKCDCGVDVSRKGLTSHKKSNKHIATMTKRDVELGTEYKEFGGVIQAFIDKAVENRLSALAEK